MAEPVIALVVATHGRAVSLAAMLRSVFAARQPDGHSVELVVVANASPQSAETARSLGIEAPPWLHLQVIDEPRAGKCHALNRGVAASSAALLAFTDDDVALDVGYFEGLLAAFADDPAIDALQGRVVVDPPQPRPPWWGRHCEALMASTVYLDERPHPLHDLNGCNMAVRRARCPAFNEHMGPGVAEFPSGEDVEWSHRLVEQGARLRYVPQMAVKHRVPPSRLTPGSLLMRAFMAGRLEGTLEALPSIHRLLLRMAIDGARLLQHLLTFNRVAAAERAFALCRQAGVLRGLAMRRRFRQLTRALRTDGEGRNPA